MSKKKPTKQDKPKARKRPLAPAKATEAAPAAKAEPVEAAEPVRAKPSSAKPAKVAAKKATESRKAPKPNPAKPSQKPPGRRVTKARTQSVTPEPTPASEEPAELSFANSPFADGEAEPSAGTELGADSEPGEGVPVEAKGKPAKAGKQSGKQASRKRGKDESQMSHAALAEAGVFAAEAAPLTAESAEPSPEVAAASEVAQDGIDAALGEDDWSEEADVAGAIAASLLEGDGEAAELDPDEPELSDEETNHRYLKGLIESLLFSAEKPLSMRELARAARLDKKRTTELLKEVTRDFRKRGMNVVEIAGGFGFRSNPAYAPYVQKLLSLRPVRLSRAQLETLAVIAYRQPVTRPEVDDVRGVDSGQVIKGLLDRDLIKMLGKKDEVGRPMLYGTTPAFLELFSLESLKDLPNLREFTELSDDSREKFKDAMGESAPGGSVLESNGQPPVEEVLGDEFEPDSEPFSEPNEAQASDVLESEALETPEGDVPESEVLESETPESDVPESDPLNEEAALADALDDRELETP